MTLPTTGAGPSGAGGNGLLNGLLCYLPFTEAAGNTRVDLHGSYDFTETAGNVGTDSGKVYATAATFVGGQLGFVLERSAFIPYNGNDWTIAVWVKLDSNASSSTPWTPGFYRMILSDLSITGRDLGTNYGKQVFIRYGISPGIMYSLHSSFVQHGDLTGAWRLICAWFDAAALTLHLQIDNNWYYTESKGSASWSGSRQAQIIGNYSRAGASYSWDGEIGPFMAWDRQLSAGQMALLWNGGAGLAYTEFS